MKKIQKFKNNFKDIVHSSASFYALMNLYINITRTFPMTLIFFSANFKFLYSLKTSENHFLTFGNAAFAYNWLITIYNHFHNILRVFEVLPNFLYTTSETLFCKDS